MMQIGKLEIHKKYLHDDINLNNVFTYYARNISKIKNEIWENIIGGIWNSRVSSKPRKGSKQFINC